MRSLFLVLRGVLVWLCGVVLPVVAPSSCFSPHRRAHVVSQLPFASLCAPTVVATFRRECLVIAYDAFRCLVRAVYLA